MNEFVFLLEIGGGGEEPKQTFIVLVCAMWTNGRFPSFCCKDCYITIVICSFMFISVFNSTVQLIPCHNNKICQAQHCMWYRHA